MSGKVKLTTKELVLCAMFAALVAVGAFIKIPIGIVPVTFQLFFAVLAGLILGSRLGAVSVFTYIIIGLIGIPVFTQGGGIGYVFQPTFGYILGFGVGTYFCGLFIEKFKRRGLKIYLIGAFVAMASIYIVGLPYLYVILTFHLGKTIDIGTLFTSYCFVFWPGDIFSCILASLLAKRLYPVVRKGNI
jgi:biotin transport system substrate-specific component